MGIWRSLNVLAEFFLSKVEWEKDPFSTLQISFKGESKINPTIFQLNFCGSPRYKWLSEPEMWFNQT